MSDVIKYVNSDNIVEDVCNIIDDARNFAYSTVDAALVLRNWYIGKRIDEEVLVNSDRAKYGAEVIKKLAEN